MYNIFGRNRIFYSERIFKNMAIKKLLKERLVKALSGISRADGENAEFSPVNLADFGKGMGIALLSGILGMSGAVFSSHPFGIAFLCACGPKYTVYSYIGLLVSSLASRGMAFALALTYTIALLLRFVAGSIAVRGDRREDIPLGQRLLKIFSLREGGEDMPKPFSEVLLLRVAISCFTAFVFGLYRLIGGGFLYYDLFGLLAGFLLTPIITFALSGLFGDRRTFEYSRETALVTLAFITVYSLGGHSFFGFSPALTLAFFVTLWAASWGGGLKGCAVGLLAGLACTNTAALMGYEPTISGILPSLMAFAGLSMGVIKSFIGNFAIVPTIAIASALGWVFGGFSSLQSFLPDMLSASVIFLPMAKYGILPKLAALVKIGTAKRTDAAMLLMKKEADSRQRLEALSEALSHLSDTVYSLSDRMRKPGVVDLKQVCDRAFSAHCDRCSLASICLEKEYMSTLDAQSKVTAALYRKGRAELDDLPAYMKSRCPSIQPILEEMNHAAARLTESLIKSDRTEAFAIDYEVMAKLLSARIAENDEEYRVDSELTKKLNKSLGYMGIAARSAICFGNRKKQVIVGDFDISRVRLGADEIKTAVENTVGIPMAAPTFSIEGEDTTMCLAAKRRYRIRSALASGMKSSEKANGDNTAVFTNRDGYAYAIISDGMGSGKEAAITSKICSVFAERMLGAGNSVAITMEMLNGFIRNKGGECSATVDLAEIDLISGSVSFIKSGAAPSFVLRGGNIYKLQSKTLPIGIMPELDAEKIKFELEAEDVIVMLSDGITATLEDGIWLANLLTYEWEEDLKIMADKILEAAEHNTKRGDDMTVVLVKVEENEEE